MRYLPDLPLPTRPRVFGAYLLGILLAVGTRSATAVEHAEICRYCRSIAAQSAVAQAAAADDSAGAPRRNYAPDRLVDVRHVKLDVTPNFDRATVSGTATLRFAPIAKPL